MKKLILIIGLLLIFSGCNSQEAKPSAYTINMESSSSFDNESSSSEQIYNIYRLNDFSNSAQFNELFQDSLLPRIEFPYNISFNFSRDSLSQSRYIEFENIDKADLFKIEADIVEDSLGLFYNISEKRDGINIYSKIRFIESINNTYTIDINLLSPDSIYLSIYPELMPEQVEPLKLTLSDFEGDDKRVIGLSTITNITFTNILLSLGNYEI